MKPDQHKIKKNSVYKKKHGISSYKQTPSSDSSKGERRVDKNLAQKHISGGNHSISASRGYNDHHQSRTTGQFSEKSVENENNTSKFARRKIVTNWQKYEVDIDSHKETLRGADYSELLQSTSIIVPQFQFGRFNSIDEEPVVANGDSDGLQKYLSFDLDHLAAALQCIPLHQRLDVEESLFEESYLEAFRQDAARHLIVYQQKFERGITETDLRLPADDSHSTRSVVPLEDVVTDLIVNDTIKHSTDGAAIHCLDETANSELDRRSSTDCSSNQKDVLVLEKQFEELFEAENLPKIIEKTTVVVDSLASNTFETGASSCSTDSNAPYDLSEATVPGDLSVSNDDVTDGSSPNAANSLHDKSLAELEDELDSLLAL